MRGARCWACSKPAASTIRRTPKYIMGLADILVEQGRYRKPRSCALRARSATHDRHCRRFADEVGILSQLGAF